MKIVIGNDHAGVKMKDDIKKHLEKNGHSVINVGTDSLESCNYPDVAKEVGKIVNSKEADLGILICGTGVGMSMSANKIHGIRACVCSEAFSAMLSRRHNNANVLCLGARVIGDEMANYIVDSWLSVEFEGGRHQKRVDLIKKLEEEY